MADKSLYSLLVDLKANTAQLQKDMDSAVGILQRATGKMGSVMRGFFEGLGANMADELVRTLKQLPSLMSDLADKGDKAGAVLDNFGKLGGSAKGLEDARRALLGTVDAFDLMQAANEAMVRGIPGVNKHFAEMAEFANRFADATGQDTMPVLDELIDALASGAPKALAKFGFSLDEGATKVENQVAVLGQFKERMDELAPLGESVQQGQERLASAISTATKSIGIAINESEGLTRAYNELAGAVEQVDWHEVGESLASVAGSFTTLATSILPSSTAMAEFARGLEFLVGKSKQAKADMLALEIGNLERDAKYPRRRGGMGEMLGILSETPEETSVRVNADDLMREEAAKELARKREELQRLVNEMNNPGAPLPAAPGSDPAYQAWRQQLARDQADLERLRRDGASRTNREAADERKRLEQEADAELEWQRRREVSDRLSAEAQARDDIFSFDDFDFSAVKSSWGDVFGQIADQFGGDMAGTLRQLGDQFGKQINYVINDAFNQSTAEAHGAGLQGPGQQNGMFSGGQTDYAGWFNAGMTVLGSFMSADERDKDQTDNRAYGESAGAAVGAVIAGAFSFGTLAPLGAAIGGTIGKEIGKLIGRGSQDEDTQQRHIFANWMEDKFEEIGGFNVYNRDSGRFRRVTNFMEGSRDRFNAPGWGDEFNKQPDSGVFSGLGMGFKELLGLEKEIGSQLGVLLFENLEGNVNNARMLMKRLGVSYQEIEEAMVEVGRQGEKTWLEIEVGLQGASQAFGDGLKEIGDYNLAMQMLIDSGGKGFEAIQSVRNIGIEAKEAQIEDFAQLREHLLKTWDPEIVDAFFRAAEQRGVTSIDQLAGLDDRTAGGFVADMDAAGVKFKESAEALDGSTKELSGTMKDNISAIRENTAAIRGIEFSAPDDDLEEPEAAYARGGVVTGPQRALMGEAGPEAILPLTRKNGVLGVSLHGLSGGNGGGYVIHIDARGAGPGVEHEVRRAAREIEERVVNRVARSMRYQRGRSV